MKFALTMRVTALFLVSLLVAMVPAQAGDKKDKPASAQAVDSGSFGIFIRGQRVATETFSIQQLNGASSIKSQFKEASGNDATAQKSDLQITSAGALVKYDWSQSVGGSLTVVPNNDFLLERVIPPASAKAAEQPFLMPSTSSILDNNFFIHREVLAWRYLAANCKSDPAGLKCDHTPGDFGVLVPQDRASLHVRMELVGKEKVTIRGTERELLRLNLTGDNLAWSLWVDDHDQFKLVRVAIAADNTEVVRD